MMRIGCGALAASLLLSSVGCASRATQAAGRIHVGMDGIQVEERLGKPLSKEIHPQEGEVWTYTYAADSKAFPRSIALTLFEIALNVAIITMVVVASCRGSGSGWHIGWLHLESRSIKIGFASGRVHSIVVSR
ncbi:MAG TPA: hypothetical protein VFS19_06325 [Planctomycetota bacterium]|nr:hypothetical protein [Planctomycetota bacterium]